MNGKTYRQESGLIYMACVWEEMQKAGKARGREREIEALCIVADKAVPALVELRCDTRGHLLAGVHQTRYGQLLWSLPSRTKGAPALIEAISKIPEFAHWKNVSLKWAHSRLDFRDDLLRGEPDSAFMPTPCRCGMSLLDYHEMFAAADRAQAQHRKIVIRAASPRTSPDLPRA